MPSSSKPTPPSPSTGAARPTPGRTPISPACRLSLGAALLLALTACSTTAPSSLPRLRAHPDYEDALRCAPAFSTDALKTIADLERVLTLAEHELPALIRELIDRGRSNQEIISA